MNTPPTGTYRRLFAAGLTALLDGHKLSKEDAEHARQYLAMLSDPTFQFGQFGRSGNRYWRPGELFLRS